MCRSLASDRSESVDTAFSKDRVQKSRKSLIQFISPQGRHASAAHFPLINHARLPQYPKVMAQRRRSHIDRKRATGLFGDATQMGNERQASAIAESFQNIEYLNVVEVGMGQGRSGRFHLRLALFGRVKHQLLRYPSYGSLALLTIRLSSKCFLEVL